MSARYLAKRDRPLEITEDLGRYLVSRSRAYWILEAVRIRERMAEIDREPHLKVPENYTPAEGFVLYGAIKSRTAERLRLEKDYKIAMELSE